MVVLTNGGGGAFLSHSWSGAFIFMHPAVLEELAAPPPPSTPQHEQAGSGFGVGGGVPHPRLQGGDTNPFFMDPGHLFRRAVFGWGRRRVTEAEEAY